jgi:hypothetical protein
MSAMTNLRETFMPVTPFEFEATILDTDDDVFDYLLDGGIAPDKDGNVRLLVDEDEYAMVPLKGLYRLQITLGGVTVPGPGLLATPEQFKKDFTA